MVFLCFQISSREHLLPTKATILALKARKVSYIKGHDLLKRKADSLQARYRELKLKIDEKQQTTMQQLKQAYFQLVVTRKTVNQDLFTLAQSTLSFTPRSTIHQTVASVGGIKLPDLTIQIIDQQLFQNNISSEVLTKSQKIWEELVTNLVELAAMKASYNTLAEVILQTNRRVNALEYKLLPEIDQNIAYINDVLDEEERSNLFVMKMVKNMIEQQNEQENQKLKSLVGEEVFQEIMKANEKAKSGVIQQEQDEDLVF